MRNNWKNSKQLAVSYWNALNSEIWSYSGGVPEGSVDTRCKRLVEYRPTEDMSSFPDEPTEDIAEALDFLEEAIQDFWNFAFKNLHAVKFGKSLYTRSIHVW